MKYLIFFTLSILMNACALHANKNKIENNVFIELSQIELKDNKIDSLIHVIIEQNKEFLKKDCFLFVSINNGSENNSIEVIIAPYEKERFRLTCSENDYAIIGYTEMEQQIVLFIGEVYSEKMKITKQKKEFTFTCRQEDKDHPPSMYNPTIHKFLLRSNGEIEYTQEN